MHNERSKNVNPLKILHTESSWGWGGQEVRILTESKALIVRGHEVCIAAPPDTPILQEAQALGIEAIGLPIRRKKIAGVLAIRKLVCNRHFDVINTHSSTDSWLTVLACQTVANAPRVVRTRHVSTPVRSTAANRWLFGKATARIVTTGEAVREMLIQDLGLDADRVVSIPTGVDSNLYKPVTKEQKKMLREKLGIPKDKLVVGTVATLRFLKGIEYLFEAVRVLNNAHCVLYVVGDGPQRTRLESWIVEHGMESRIMMVGEQRNVHEWLQSFDIFVFPSLSEGVPQALAQAMLTELPCVTTNVGGIPELAIDQVTALVTKPRDPQALANAVNALISIPIRAESMGSAARLHCISAQSLETMARKMEIAFEKDLPIDRRQINSTD